MKENDCNRVFWIHIVAMPKYNCEQHEKIFLDWKDLPWHVVKKWNWYFRYRAALLQVEHPRWEIDFKQGNEVAKSDSEINRRFLDNKIRSKKSTITIKTKFLENIENDFNDLKDNWTEIFPIEQHEKYQATVDKINSLRFNLEAMKMDLKDLEREYEFNFKSEKS
jgi:hypothetical protein